MEECIVHCLWGRHRVAVVLTKILLLSLDSEVRKGLTNKSIPE